MNTMNHPIETTALTKLYGSVKAVDRLSLQVNEGEIYAFLGLNGAGKSTTIRLLLGMSRATSGTATVLGQAVRMGSSQPWAAVGYLVESSRAYPELTVYENLEVARRLHPGTPRKAINEVIDRLGLAPYAERRAGTLSMGNAQRLGLAKALLHSPRVLILDEPTNGLDPAGIVEIRELLLSLVREQGVTIFMSSHILGEVARLAQRIAIIHNGRLLQEINIDELRCNRKKRLLVRTRDQERARAALANAGHNPVFIDGALLQLTDQKAIECPEAIATLLVGAGVPPIHLLVEEEELEHYFLRLIGHEHKV